MVVVKYRPPNGYNIKHLICLDVANYAGKMYYEEQGRIQGGFQTLPEPLPPALKNDHRKKLNFTHFSHELTKMMNFTHFSCELKIWKPPN